MLLVALAFIGLVAFIGLTVDAGILFSQIGHLRRATDAAALAAASQIREGWTDEKIREAASELILVNLPGVDTLMDVTVETCNNDPPAPNSIPGCDTGIRKLARVKATLQVDFVFMPIIGFNGVPIRAEAVSEAAAVDLVLVIDTSTSMTYDAPQGNPQRDPATCNPARNCHPFEEVRAAAIAMVNKIFWTGNLYDRVALVTFDKFPGVVDDVEATWMEDPLHQPEVALTNDKNAVITALNAMTVFPNFDSADANPDNDPEDNCYWSQGDPRGCMRTNTAGGLMLAGKELSERGRQESVWVVVLLTDGVANAAYAVDTSNYSIYSDPTARDGRAWYCPGAWWREITGHEDGDPEGPPGGYGVGTRVGDSGRSYFPDNWQDPLCTDGDPYIGYETWPDGMTLQSDSDADDAARFWADWIGCLPTGENDPTEGKGCPRAGLGGVIFTIGLGYGVVNDPDGPYGYLSGLPNPPYQSGGYVGEQLLRYIANVGYEGNPSMSSSSDPCYDFNDYGQTADWGTQCGNYYYAQSGLQLNDIFEAIAERIFTRLTH